MQFIRDIRDTTWRIEKCRLTVYCFFNSCFNTYNQQRCSSSIGCIVWVCIADIVFAIIFCFIITIIVTNICACTIQFRIIRVIQSCIIYSYIFVFFIEACGMNRLVYSSLFCTIQYIYIKPYRSLRTAEFFNISCFCQNSYAYTIWIFRLQISHWRKIF